MDLINYLLIALVVLLAGIAIYLIIQYPAKVRQWLVYATAEAEKELKSGTGQLKLKYVYNLFIDKYPLTSKIISFETFSSWVDVALQQLKELLKNENIQQYIVEDKTTVK